MAASSRSGRAGILPGTADVADAAQHARRTDKLHSRANSILRNADTVPRLNGPGRIPGPAGRKPDLSQGVGRIAEAKRRPAIKILEML